MNAICAGVCCAIPCDDPPFCAEAAGLIISLPNYFPASSSVPHLEFAWEVIDVPSTLDTLRFSHVSSFISAGDASTRLASIDIGPCEAFVHLGERGCRHCAIQWQHFTFFGGVANIL